MPEATITADSTPLAEMTLEDIFIATEKIVRDERKNSLPRKAARFVRRHQNALIAATLVSVVVAVAAKKIDVEEATVIDAIAE